MTPLPNRPAVVIRATLCRLSCPEHGVVTEAVQWAAHDSRFTHDFEDGLGRPRDEQDGGEEPAPHRLATFGNIIERMVAGKIDRAQLEPLCRIGIDEVSYRTGHKYLTVVANRGTGDPVWIDEGRSQATLGKFCDELGAERAETLGAINMDMCAPYVQETKARAPRSEIAFDPSKS